MTSTLATILFGLAASLGWGSGDFCGGLASRRSPVATVITITYTTGFVLLLALALIWREPFLAGMDILWGILAGIVGVLALLFFYSALAIGRMGIIAPVSAVLTAGLPLTFSAFTEGLPNLLQIGGFFLALVAIVLVSRPERSHGRPKGIGLAMLAGCGFGLFFIIISRVSPHAVFWPLALARLVSVLILLLLALFRKQPIKPQKKLMSLMILSGTMDALGNAFFVLAAHSGRLDIASVLSSLYPAATVILAAIILRERVTRIQGLGILLALVAIPLISV